MDGIDPEIVSAINRLVDSIADENVVGESFLELAKTYHANGLDSWADKTYEIYLDQNPQDAKAHYWKGIACSSLGNLEVAKVSFEKCLVIRPDYPPATWRLALVHLETGDTDTAKKLVDQAAQLSPKDDNVLLIQARTLLALSRPEEALLLLNSKDFENSPNAGYSRFLKGTAIVQSRNAELEELGKVYLASQNPRPQWSDPWRGELHQFELGISGKRIKASQQYRRSKFDEAIEVLKECTAHPNADGRDWNLMAVCYLSTGNRAKAREVMEKGLEKHPLDLDLNMNLARIYLEVYLETKASLLDRASEMLLVVVGKSPDRWEPYDVLGRIHSLKGDLEQSLAYYQKACLIAPANQLCHWYKVFLLLDLGNVEQAEKEISNFTNEQQSSAYGEYSRAEILWQAKKIDASRELLSQIDQSSIRDPDLVERIKTLKRKVETPVPAFEIVE